MPRHLPRAGASATRVHQLPQRPPAPNPVLHQAIMDIVDNQLRDNTPPQTRLTLERLLAQGHSLDEARRLIGYALSTQIYAILAQHRPFDQGAYITALQRLPVLPWEEQPASR